MNKKASAPSLDGRDHRPSPPVRRPIETCGRRTTISLDDGFPLDTGPGQRVVAFLMSRFAGDGSMSDLAVAAAVCRDDGTLVHQLDDPLAGLPFGACVDAAIDRDASWHRSLGAALRNVDVVVTPGAWAQRQAVEAVHDGFSHLDWGCARKDINWPQIALPSDRFAEIRARFRILQCSRRALDECRLAIDVLTQPGRPGHEPPLAQLFASVDASVVRLFAGDVPAVHMPVLLERGYRWSPGLNGAPKGYFVDRARDVARFERRFLAQLLGLDEVDLLERSLPASERFRLP